MANYDYHSDEYKKVFEDSMREFSQMQIWRNTTALQWEEVANLIAPNYRNTFFYNSYNFPGVKKTQQQIDASGQMALARFAAICDSLLTPRNMFWHSLEADNEQLMKDRAVRLWYEQATKVLFKQRYAATANFASQNGSIFTMLGAFGTAGMFVDTYYDLAKRIRGLRYRAMPLGELYIRENHQGQVDGFVRHFRLTAQQCYQQFPDTFPDTLRPALERGDQTPYTFLHRVCPRDDYDYRRIDAKGKPYASYYISIEGQCILSESGYPTFPAAITRYEKAPNEVYGRSIAMQVLPALKTLNSEKAVFLKQGHRASDPVLLLNDDGLIDMNLRPGALNKGGVNADGKPMVQILPTGNIQINKEMMDEEKSIINDGFLVSLFQILEETPQMTATEVIERVNEKGILLAPTVGRQQSEYLGPLIERELDLCQELRLLPPMPPALREANGEYHVVYTAPIARAMHAQEAAGFMRTVESVKELVNITQDPSLLDPFDFDTAVPAIADIQAVPVSWMATSDKIAAKRQARAKSQQQQAAIQALPAQAAMIKAQSTVQKNQPGVAPGEQGLGGPMKQPQGSPQGPTNMAGR